MKGESGNRWRDAVARWPDPGHWEADGGARGRVPHRRRGGRFLHSFHDARQSTLQACSVMRCACWATSAYTAFGAR